MPPVIFEPSSTDDSESNRGGIVDTKARRPATHRDGRRKGKGHPKSICDAIGEELSLALSQEYLTTFGRILHHNADKAMLVAGRTEPRLGGGNVLEPMRLVLSHRAVTEYDGKHIEVGAIPGATAKNWLRQNLRFVDPARHLVFQNGLKEG